MGVLIIGAEGGTRTHTMLPSLDFESNASASSTTSAHLNNKHSNISFLFMQ